MVRSKRTSKYARRARYIDYMLWIKTQPCMCCGVKRGIEAAHCGSRAYGQKCSDLETLPLCKEDHTEGKHSHHRDGKNFWEFWRIDREAMFKKYQDEYRRQTGTELFEPASNEESDLCGQI